MLDASSPPPQAMTFARICLPRWSFSLALAALLAGCGGGGPAGTADKVSPASTSIAQPTAADRVAVGETLFHDPGLAANGSQACASCHAVANAHADAAGGFLPLGGPLLDQQGLRSSPSLNYLNGNSGFRFDAQGQPVGGFTWDGRADNRADQSLGPLLAAKEMAHADTAAVVRTLRARPAFSALQFAFALPASATDAQVLQALQQALSDYQSADPDYQPYSSKFDFVQQGRTAFTMQEARGLALFNDPRRGACAACHTSDAAVGQPAAAFTNFGYFALGVPRNSSSATADPNFFDMGLCGPLRTDLAHRTDLCGRFKVPTLRNVALTGPYFHNGAVATLEEAVAFYATRDIDPGRWYPTVAGVVQRFNDLPTAYRGNVTQQAPFGQQAGDAPRLSAQDASDIVAFLRTLSDGYTP